MKRIITVLVALAALGAPATALANGVVLKVQGANHLIAVRTTPAKVALVHTPAAARLHVGQRVALSTRTLRNGTLAASRVAVLGRAHRTTFRGLVLSKSRQRLVLSAGGAVISVHRSTRSTASARDDGPAPGTTVTVGVTIQSNGELDEDNVSTFTTTSPGGKIEGTLAMGDGSVTVSSEDATLVLKLPSGFDLTGFQNGDEVLATFTQGTDGSLTLSALSGDENAQEADHNSNNDQGAGGQGGDGQSGDGQGGDGQGGDGGGGSGGDD
jgi:uncharacterized membrane protein YgcG